MTKIDSVYEELRKVAKTETGFDRRNVAQFSRLIRQGHIRHLVDLHVVRPGNGEASAQLRYLVDDAILPAIASIQLGDGVGTTAYTSLLGLENTRRAWTDRVRLTAEMFHLGPDAYRMGIMIDHFRLLAGRLISDSDDAQRRSEIFHLPGEFDSLQGIAEQQDSEAALIHEIGNGSIDQADLFELSTATQPALIEVLGQAEVPTRILALHPGQMRDEEALKRMISGLRATIALCEQYPSLSLRPYDYPASVRARRVGPYLFYGSYTYGVDGWVTGHSNPLTVMNWASPAAKPWLRHFEVLFESHWEGSPAKTLAEFEHILSEYDSPADAHAAPGDGTVG